MMKRLLQMLLLLMPFDSIGIKINILQKKLI
jgi:hypothetical protein